MLRLDPADAPARINAWVREKTRGKIEAIVDVVPPDVVLEILNAVYFRGAWAQEFDAEETREGPFHLLAGGVEPLPMMSRSAVYPYFEGPRFRAVSLAYRDDMVRLTLNEVLKGLGMRRAFDPGSADFSGMAGSGRVWIGRVLQRSRIEVNERGTEAAAATLVEMLRSDVAVPVAPFRMVVDRPFLVAVRDRMTGLVLFLGAVTRPERLRGPSWAAAARGGIGLPDQHGPLVPARENQCDSRGRRPPGVSPR